MRRILDLLWKNKRKIRIFLFITYCFFIVYYTLLSRSVSQTHRIELRLMWAYREMLVHDTEWKKDVMQNIANILFFIPLGFLFPRIRFKSNCRHWKYVLFLSVCISIIIEITQYIAYLGLCELDDVICNGLGALLGSSLYEVIIKNKSVEKCYKGLKE